MKTFEKAMMLSIAAIGALLVTAGFWSFIITMACILIGLSLFVYYNQEP